MLKILAPSDAQLLREFFGQADYGPELILREPQLRDLRVRRGPGFFTRLREPSIPSLLLAWFYAGESVPPKIVNRLIPDSVLACLLGSGLLAQDADGLASPVMLTSIGRLLFASDNSARWRSQPNDLVIWPNPSSQLLDRFTLRRPVETTLDIGTGCGIQAILAASHSRQVTATDLNPRALDFTRFNAWLNGVDNVECLTGDGMEPVGDRSFDLIVSNPPFFITPSSGRLYCENGMELDGYCRRIAIEAGRHLNEGGWAQMTLEWVQIRGQAWQGRLRTWMRDIGCDAMVLEAYARPAFAYARERIEQSPAGVADADTLAQWLDYYERRGVEQIHGGMLAMRRRAGRNWIRIEDAPEQPAEPFGESILHAFSCVDFSESHKDDTDLLSARPRLAPEAQLVERSHAADGRWRRISTTLRLTCGLPNSIWLDSAVADFVARLDGRQSLADVIAVVAACSPADFQVVQRDCLAVTRQLFDRRFLRP